METENKAVKRTLRPVTRANRVFLKIQDESFEMLRVLRDRLNFEMEMRQTHPNYKKIA